MARLMGPWHLPPQLSLQQVPPLPALESDCQRKGPQLLRQRQGQHLHQKLGLLLLLRQAVFLHGCSSGASDTPGCRGNAAQGAGHASRKRC